ncbi:MAG TPA: hypothetical protein VFZ52_22170 [Chryseolinea sp.]
MKPVTNDHLTEKGILNLVEAFRTRALPASEWTHEAHLVTGLWFNYTYSELEAVCFLRSGIISYNISVGGENTPEKGYHETLTLFWCKVLHAFVKNNREMPVTELCKKFLQSQWSSKEVPLQYYSRERLFSLRARATWVAPDLKALS